MIDIDWRSPTAMADWQAACEAERAVTAATGRTAMERACDALRLAGGRSPHAAVKVRARAYLRRPMDMVAVDARLPFATPHTMLAIAEHHLDIEARRHRRLIGMGGEVPLVNARAVKLAARWLRRFGEGSGGLVAAE